MELIDRLVGRHVAAGRGHRIAYVDSDLGEVSYARLGQAARRYAGLLRERRVPPGRRALVVGDDSVATVVAVLGLWAHRCVPVPVSPMLTDAELAFIAEDCAAAMIHVDGPAARRRDLERLFAAHVRVTGEAVRDLFAAGGPGPLPQAPAAAGEPWPADREVLVQYTSGSTGRPKGVLHGPAGVEAVLRGFGAVLDLGPDDTVLSTAKLSFGYGFGNSLLFPLAAGARAVLLRGPVDAHRLSLTIAQRRPTVLFSVPRLYLALLTLADRERVPDLRSLRCAVSAGEHLPADLRTRFERTFGVPLVNGLGATEVLHIVVTDRRVGSAAPPLRAPAGSTGWPVPGVTATVRDAEGRELAGDGTRAGAPTGARGGAPGEGRLHIAGPSVALGYLARPEQTRRTFAEGGAYTGDIVRHGGAGDLRYVCRADDLLNLGGHKVSPLEIEAVVRRAPGVADCAVAGTTDEAGLQQAVAYVVAALGADRETVRRGVVAALREGLSSFKRPSRVEVLDKLPTTSTGKLARFRLGTPPADAPPADAPPDAAEADPVPAGRGR